MRRASSASPAQPTTFLAAGFQALAAAQTQFISSSSRARHRRAVDSRTRARCVWKDDDGLGVADHWLESSSVDVRCVYQGMRPMARQRAVRSSARWRMGSRRSCAR